MKGILCQVCTTLVGVLLIETVNFCKRRGINIRKLRTVGRTILKRAPGFDTKQNHTAT